jgi:hypothetical protein
VSLSRLQKQLTRDLKANPKKAGMLGLLAVLAAWFWAPLIFGGKPSQTVVQATPVPPAAAVRPAGQPTAGATADIRPAWQDLNRWMAEDAQMTSARLSESQRNPFANSPHLTASAAAQAKALAEKAVLAQLSQDDPQTRQQLAATPREDEIKSAQDLGLVLSATVITHGRRAALINGRVYEEGVALKADGMAFVVEEVRPDQVVLGRAGQQFKLAIKRSQKPITVKTAERVE